MKKLHKIWILCLLYVILTGCSGNDKFKLDAEELCNESNEFQFKDLAWESSTSEVEAAVGCTLEMLGTVGNRQEYVASESFEWEGVKAELTCEFEQEKLDTVTFLFRPTDEQNEFWTKLKDVMLVAYGNIQVDIQASTSEELQITTERESYFWEKTDNRHTALEISKVSINGEFKYIMLSVYTVPEKDK